MRRILWLPVPLLFCTALSAPAQTGAAVAPSVPPSTLGSSGPDAAGVYTVGGDVRSPAVISLAQPDYDGLHVSGNVVVALVVDAKGMPQDVHVVRGLGHGADEKAIATVRGYRFKPALKGTTPVPVRVVVEVRFEGY